MPNTSPTRIVYCEGNTDGTIGGSFYSLLFLVSGLDKSRYEPIVVFHEAHALLPKYHAAGIRTLIIPAYSPTHLVTNRTPKFLTMPLGLIQKSVNLFRGFVLRGLSYARLLRKLDADMLHLNNSIVRNHDWMLGALIARVPCITHERGINQHYPGMARFFARRLQAIVCISNAVKNTLSRHAMDHGNLVTIYNGIDPDIVQPRLSAEQVRDKHKLDTQARLIGVIGNIKAWKGQETIVRAMPAILARFPAVVCLLVGDTSPSDMEYKHQLTALCEELAITDRVIFTGYTDNVGDYLNVLDIVIHTSVDDEPFGRVLIEAMAMHKPLIGAHGGAVPEIIDIEKTGLTFPPGDAQALAAAVIRLLDDPALAGNMGRNGRTRLCEKFDIRTNVQATAELYDRLLGRPQ